MKHWWPLSLLALCACGDQQERLAADAIRAGNAHYEQGGFDLAIEEYDNASFDPRALHNSAKAAYRAGDFGAAVDRSISTTELATDTSLLADAFHDLGNAWLFRSRAADSLGAVLAENIAAIRMEGDDITGKVRLAVARDSMRQEQQRNVQLSDSALAQAVIAFKQGLRYDPTDEDTRFNLAFGQKLLAARQRERKEQEDQKKKDQELSERAKALLKQADQLVDQYKFKEALELLQRGLQEDPSLANKKEYIDKLDVVTKAAAAT